MPINKVKHMQYRINVSLFAVAIMQNVRRKKMYKAISFIA